jgi:beta-ureidopropionase / N-carbamoyl-L-amino-acid hydrolase
MLATAPAATPNALRIDAQRLWASLMTLAEIGATPKGGVCRLALSELDRQARDLFVRWAREAGCTVRVDAIGNLFARREGTEPGAGRGHRQPHRHPAHGRQVRRQLRRARRAWRCCARWPTTASAPSAPLELCVWTNEEGSRFVPVMMGSGVYAGAFTLEHALSAADREGTSVRQALAAIGYAGTAPAALADGAPRFGAFFEAHIEQGPVLEDTGTIGVVTGALGQRWYDVVVTGQEAHAGPTPMDLRRDALQAALRLMQQVDAIARAEAPHARGTVGYVHVFPNSRNTIPGRVTFTVDFRHTDDEGLQRMDAALREAIAALQAERRVAT